MQSAQNDDRPPARRSVGLHDLETRAAEIVREVRESGEAIDVADDGVVVARIEPSHDIARGQPPRFATMEEWLRATEELAQEIGRRWPKGVSAQEAIDDVRGPW